MKYGAEKILERKQCIYYGDRAQMLNIKCLCLEKYRVPTQAIHNLKWFKSEHLKFRAKCFKLWDIHFLGKDGVLKA